LWICVVLFLFSSIALGLILIVNCSIGEFKELFESQKYAVYVFEDRILGGLGKQILVGFDYKDPPLSSFRLVASEDGWASTRAFVPVAHGLAPRGHEIDDTEEDFIESLARGYMIFEVDIVLTQDGNLICYHSEVKNELEKMTLYEFRDKVKANSRTPCDFNSLVRWAKTHTDIKFILDVKTPFRPSYERIIDDLKGTGVERSFIPQIYNFQDLPWLANKNVFVSYIFTAYRSYLPTEEIIRRSRRAGIGVVTLPIWRLKSLRTLPKDLLVFVHPVDNIEFANSLRSMGVRGIYTSKLNPKCEMWLNQ